MKTTAGWALAIAALGLAGCQPSDDEAGAPPAAEAGQKVAGDAAVPPAPAPGGAAPTEWSEDDVVWADDEFLEKAGIKPGKDVIYLPTPPMVATKMVEMANIKETDLVYDLGTGDGRIAIAAAKMTGARAVGFEIDEELVKIARENVKKEGLEDRVRIEHQDVLTLDYSQPDVVLMFLNPDLNVKLLPHFESLKPGARVVSHDFDMKGLVEPDMVVENFRSDVPDFVNIHNLYRWTAPLKQKQ